jgi:hypothetical protein
MAGAMTNMDVEISDARPARSPDIKAAIAYLIASGATAISIVEHDGVCSFHVGHKIDPARSRSNGCRKQTRGPSP